MKNLLDELAKTFGADDRLVIDGKLAKNKIVELDLALDKSLIKLLLKNEATKKWFFLEVDGIQVFDKVKFQKFVSNKEFLPDCYTAFKNKIGLTSGGEYLYDNREVVLDWPYKDCVFEGGQSTEDQIKSSFDCSPTLLLSSRELLNSNTLSQVPRVINRTTPLISCIIG